MICTERDAELHWCPFARFREAWKDAACNRFGEDENPLACRCIASQCMAWEWVNPGKKDEGYCGLVAGHHPPW